MAEPPLPAPFNPTPHPAACSVLYLTSVETESLTGPQAVARASSAALSCSPRPTPAVVHFKVSAQGITLTDNQRKYVCQIKPLGDPRHRPRGPQFLADLPHPRPYRLFFRRHYPVNSITFSSTDPQDRR